MGFLKAANTWLGVLLFLNLGNITLAQNQSLATVTINATLVKGLNINLVNGDLDFGNIILSGISTKVTKTPDKGIYLEVNGHPGQDVVIDYDNTSLTNKPWIQTYGGTEGNLTFEPDVEFSNSESDYSYASTASSGNTYNLSSSVDKPSLHLWIGGEIDIPNDLPNGDYSGQFIVTVSY